MCRKRPTLFPRDHQLQIHLVIGQVNQVWRLGYTARQLLGQNRGVAGPYPKRQQRPHVPQNRIKRGLVGESGVRKSCGLSQDLL